MEALQLNRPRWEIEELLSRLLGADIRVRARSFSPPKDLRRISELVPVQNLFLPDNAQSSGLPVFFEGNLSAFRREGGFVLVSLAEVKREDVAADGFTPFRKELAVLVQGPAIVELDFPFWIERLPAGSENYWRDLHLPRAQFTFPF